jgi:succinyl-diaminopimelate desuccinylase
LVEPRDALLQWIAEDEQAIAAFVSELTRAKSPNPPGDTQEAAAVVSRLLDQNGIAHEIVAPNALKPNVVATFSGRSDGPHVVFNGHLDTYPVDPFGWTTDPWGGEIRDGRIYGRGVNDMKAGTAASLFAFLYLHRLREAIPGRVTLTAVSDEESFGPDGARYLVANRPDVLGDVLLNAEPTGIGNMRFGEKAPVWIALTIRTPGAHGAYVHKSPSAIKLAAEVIRDLEALTALPVETPAAIAELLRDGAAAMDEAQTPGASKIIDRVTVNIGTIHGGLKVNMVPSECRLEVDIRVPVGQTTEAVLDAAREIASRREEVTFEVLSSPSPLWSDPHHPMVHLIQETVAGLIGTAPKPVISLPGTDARLWRGAGIPAFVYGITPRNVAMADEYVEIAELLHILRTHALATLAYLTTESGHLN